MGCAEPSETRIEEEREAPIDGPADRGASQGLRRPVALAPDGVMVGTYEGEALAWKGIPYAEPPIGPLRWRPPRRITPVEYPIDASRWTRGCIQVTDAGELRGGEEDCLRLNVWAPQGATAGSLPVLFFIHGGAWIVGSSAVQSWGTRLYDGGDLAVAARAVVVTINYRLGALGFLAHREMRERIPDGEPGRGNFGILDQIAALEWVQRNIEAFGGDPSRVMVFGQSAGGASTCILVASPLARGLFSTALIQSGRCEGRAPAVAEALGDRLAESLGCAGSPNVTACLRSLPAETVALAVASDFTGDSGPVGSSTWGPVIDGVVLPAKPLSVIADGAHNDVPFVIGTTADEYASVLSRHVRRAPRNDEEYRAIVEARFGADAEAILERYPSASYTTPVHALVAVLTDSGRTCVARRIARTVASSQTSPVWRYFYTHVVETGPMHELGAAHGSELPFVFQALDRAQVDGFMPTDAERRLSAELAGYWARFAATGDPNGDGATHWPLFRPVTDDYLELETPARTAAGVRTDQCDFWDALELVEVGE